MNDNNVIRPLCIRLLPQMIGMLNTLIVVRQCLLKSKNYIKIRGKISSLINIEFDSKHVNMVMVKNT